MDVFLTTERLLLRRFTMSDVDSLVELDSDPEVMRFITGGHPTRREVVRDAQLPAWIADYQRLDGLGRFAAQERSTGAFVGRFALEPWTRTPAGGLELGWRLRRDVWGRGYATEAGRALLGVAFTDHATERVAAFTMAVNTRSRAVMERLGLTCVRTHHLTWDDPIPGVEHGDVEYELRRRTWSARPSTQD